MFEIVRFFFKFRINAHLSSSTRVEVERKTEKVNLSDQCIYKRPTITEACVDPERVREWEGDVLPTFKNIFILVINVVHRGSFEPFSSNNWTLLLLGGGSLGSISARRRFVPVFIRKTIVTCDFPGRGDTARLFPFFPCEVSLSL